MPLRVEAGGVVRRALADADAESVRADHLVERGRRRLPQSSAVVLQAADHDRVRRVVDVGGDAVGEVRDEAAAEPSFERRRVGGEGVRRAEDSAVGAGVEVRRGPGGADRHRVPVGMDVRQRLALRADRRARHPVGDHVPVLAGVARAHPREVAADEDAVVIARVDGDRLVVPGLVVHHVEVRLVLCGVHRAAGLARRDAGVGRVHLQAGPGRAPGLREVDVLLRASGVVGREQVDVRASRVGAVGIGGRERHAAHVAARQRRPGGECDAVVGAEEDRAVAGDHPARGAGPGDAPAVGRATEVLVGPRSALDLAEQARVGGDEHGAGAGRIDHDVAHRRGGAAAAGKCHRIRPADAAVERGVEAGRVHVERVAEAEEERVGAVRVERERAHRLRADAGGDRGPVRAAAGADHGPVRQLGADFNVGEALGGSAETPQGDV